MADAPVRVVHIITRMILGGAQQSALYTCDALRKSGSWDARIITGPPIGQGELLTEARRRGVPCTVIPEMRREIHPWRDLVAFLRLIRLLRDLRPAVVHTHSSKAGILGRLAAAVARVPVIVHSVRGLPFHPYAPFYQNVVFLAAERVTALVTDHFVCVARAMADRAQAAGMGPPDEFSVIPSGIQVEPYRNAEAQRERMRRRYGFSPEDVVIGKIARLVELKGQRFLVRAAPAIAKARPEARFLLVGDGPLRPELEALAERLGVRSRFVFAGMVPPEEIPPIISAMDVVVHTSLREGLARVLLQGLLCEKPVVTFALDGAPEVILDGETGRLVEPESVEGLARAVIQAVEQPERSRRMAREGKRRFEEAYSVRSAVRQTERLYRRLLAHKNRPVPAP